MPRMDPLVLLALFAASPALASDTVAPWAPLALGDGVPGFHTPVDIVNAGDGSHRLFVVQQDGLIKVVEHGKITGTFLDAKKVVGRVGGEQGLLGLAFHPRFKENHRFFIAYTDARQNDAVAEVHASADGARGEMATLKVLFAVDDFAPNHNGGNLMFGPDGLLWIGVGDGGGAGDPQRTAQNPDRLLGKMLVLDVDKLGRRRARPEVRWLGLRNPWRYAFDQGDMWIADVGQDLWEEIDFVPKADIDKRLNFGWSVLEGDHCYRPKKDCDRTGMTMPVFEYHHGADGCSVTGGYVYRGKAAPALVGSYVFADFCSGRIWEMKHGNDGAFTVARALDSKVPVSSFGVDEDGELWLADYSGGRILHVGVKR